MDEEDRAVKPTQENQHPGRECCESCLEDIEYDYIYSLDPQCCCRSEWKEGEN